MKYEQKVNLSIYVKFKKLLNLKIGNKITDVLQYKYCNSSSTFNIQVADAYEIVYISNDSFATGIGVLLGSGETYEMSILKNTNYNIKAIMVPRYPTSTQIIFEEGQLCVHEGIVYMANEKIDAPTESFDINHWTALNITTAIATILNTETLQKDYSIGTMSCSDIYEEFFYKVDCHKYIVKESINKLKKRLVRLYNFDKSSVIDTVMDIGLEEIEVTTPGDGVWIIEIYEYDEVSGGPVGNIMTTFPIYDACNADKCYLNLVNKLNCCDYQECDDKSKKKDEDLRYAINKIVGIMYFINKYMRIEADMYLGICKIDSTRMEHIEDVNNLFVRLNMIMDQCTECESENTTIC